MLALIYGGEMCYWYFQHSPDVTVSGPPAGKSLKKSPEDVTASKPVEESPKEFLVPEDARAGTLPGEDTLKVKGVGFLTTYLGLVKGPLLHKGWDTVRATQVLQNLWELS